MSVVAFKNQRQDLYEYTKVKFSVKRAKIFKKLTQYIWRLRKLFVPLYCNQMIHEVDDKLKNFLNVNDL